MKTHTGRLILLAAMALAMLSGCAKKTAEEMLADADALFRQGNLLEAELKFEDVIDKFPNNETAYYTGNLGLAMVYAQERKFDEQRKIYDKLLKKGGGPAASNMNWMLYCQKLDSYMAEGKRAEALRETIETSSTFKTAMPEAKMAFQGTLASLYAANNQTTTALAILDNLSTHGLQDPQQQYGVLENKKQLLEPMKDWRALVAAHEDYLKRFPDSPAKGNIQLQIARYYKENLNEPAKADEAFNAAAKSFQQIYDKGISADEKSDALLRLGSVYHIRGDYDTAEKHYDRLIKEFPINDRALTAMSFKAELALGRNNPQKAIEILNEMGRVFADRVDSRAIQARIDSIKAATATTTGTQARRETAPTTGTTNQNAPTSPTAAVR